jgi:hypothetical protein
MTPIALLVTSFASGVGWPQTLDNESSIGAHLLCVVGTIGFALAPLVLFATMRRGSDPVAPRLTGAAIAAAAGAWGALAIELHCRYTSPLHVIFGHVVPVALLALAGMAVGDRFVALRSRPAARVTGSSRTGLRP